MGPTEDRKVAEILLGDFNDYRTRTQRAHEVRDAQPYMLKPLKATDERMKLFEDVVRWCREHDLEPRMWIYAIFKARQWRFAPKPTPGCLMSKNEHLIARARAMKPTGLMRARTFFTVVDAQGALDPNRDVLHTVEGRKVALAASGKERECLTTMEETLGYHPKSVVCRSCALAGECAVLLASRFPFNILALRNGEITAEQAEEQAFRASYSRP